MRKQFTIFLTLLLIFTFVLAACGQAEDELPDTGVTETDVVEGVEETDLVEVTDVVVETPEAAEETPEVMEETPAAPAEPAEATVLTVPRLTSTLLDAPVWNTTDEEIGQVQGFVMNLSNTQAMTETQTETGNQLQVGGRIDYIIVAEDDNDIPVPWGAFQVIDTDPEAGASEPEAVNFEAEDLALLLNVEDVALESAPTITAEELNNLQATEWETGIREFWSSYGDILPSTGQETGTQAGLPIYISGDGLFGGIDFDVENLDGEDLGDIQDFIVHPDGGIAYSVMETDAFLDIGGQMLLVPLNSMTYNPENERFLLPVQEEFLDAAITYVNEEDFPDFTEEGWDEELREFWQNFIPGEAQPAEGDQAAADEALFRTSTLIGANVTGQDGMALGSVNDLVFGDGEVQYVVINRNNQFQAVPWSAFNWDASTNTLVYALDPALLQQGPAGIGADAFVTTGDMAWEDEAFAFWNENADLGEDFGIDDNESAFNYTGLGNLNDAAGTALGDIEDVLIDQQGEIEYYLLNRGEGFSAIPSEQVAWDSDTAGLIYQGDQGMLEGAPDLGNLDEIDFTDPAWDDDIDNYWGLTE